MSCLLFYGIRSFSYFKFFDSLSFYLIFVIFALLRWSVIGWIFDYLKKMPFRYLTFTCENEL
jgi:hypothetical protein